MLFDNLFRLSFIRVFFSSLKPLEQLRHEVVEGGVMGIERERGESEALKGVDKCLYKASIKIHLFPFSGDFLFCPASQ